MGDWNPFPRPPKPPKPPADTKTLNVGVGDGVNYLPFTNVLVLMSKNYNVLTDADGIARLTIDKFETACGIIIDKLGFEHFAQDGYLLNPDSHTDLHVTLTKKPIIVARTGVVHYDQFKAIDNGGAHYYLGSSFFWLHWGLKNDRQRTIENLQWLAKNKVDYIRTFCEVGGPSWEDRAVNPADIDYAEHFKIVYDLGLRINPVVFASKTYSDTPDKRRATTDKVIDAILRNPQAIIYYQQANEAEKNFPDFGELQDLTNRALSRLPNLVSSSSLATNFERFPTTVGIFTIYAIHFDRTYGEDGWRYVRQPYSGRECPTRQSNCNEEGVGVESSGEKDDNPLRQGLYAATGWITQGPFHTVHNIVGRRGGGAEDLKYAPWKNFWEMPTFQAILDNINYVRDLLPLDAINWGEKNGNSSEHLLPAEHSWPDGYDNGVTRTYMALGGNQFVMLPYGIKNYSTHECKRSMTIKVYDIDQKRMIDQVTMGAGARYTFQGRPDSLAGYLVIGDI